MARIAIAKDREEVGRHVKLDRRSFRALFCSMVLIVNNLTVKYIFWK